MSRTRNKTLDILKGILGISVLYGHVNELYGNFWLDKGHIFVYLWHMPLFMLAAGYSFYYIKEKDLKELVIKRNIELAIPIVVWGLIYYLCRCVMGYTSFSIGGLITQITAEGYWFLYALIFCNLVAAPTERFLIKRSTKLLVYCIVFILMLVACEVIRPMRMITFIYPYFVAGYCYHEYKDEHGMSGIFDNKTSAFNKITYGLVLLLPILLLYFQEKDYIYTSGLALSTSELGVGMQIITNIYRWIIGFAGSAFILLIVEKIDWPEKAEKALSSLGKETLQIYVLNVVVIALIAKPLMRWMKTEDAIKVILDNSVIYPFVFVPLLTIGLLVIIHYLVKILCKNKIVSKILFGR